MYTSSSSLENLHDLFCGRVFASASVKRFTVFQYDLRRWLNDGSLIVKDTISCKPETLKSLQWSETTN